MRNAGLEEAQAGIKIAGKNINSLRYADNMTLRAENEEKLKEPLDEGERGGERKSCLKTQHSKNKDHGIWSHHFMANTWGNNGNRKRLLFSWAPKSLQMVTAAMKLKDACSLEATTDVDSVLKSRDIILPTKVCIVKTMVFPVVMYGCEELNHKQG